MGSWLPGILRAGDPGDAGTAGRESNCRERDAEYVIETAAGSALTEGAAQREVGFAARGSSGGSETGAGTAGGSTGGIAELVESGTGESDVSAAREEKRPASCASKAAKEDIPESPAADRGARSAGGAAEVGATFTRRTSARFVPGRKS